MGVLLITVSNLGFVADLDCRRKEKDEVARMIESLKNLGGRGLKVEILKDDDIQQGECVIEMHPHMYEVMEVWHKQEEILRMLTDIYVIAEVKLTLSTSGLLTCMYEHGPRNIWSAVVGRMKGAEATSSDELKKLESWLDNVEPLAKDIYKVLVVHQKLKKSEEENPLEIFPYDLGSILIKLSKLRLKWRAIASLEHANVLDGIGMTELDEIETLIKELHEVVVVQQLLQENF